MSLSIYLSLYMSLSSRSISGYNRIQGVGKKRERDNNTTRQENVCKYRQIYWVGSPQGSRFENRIERGANYSTTFFRPVLLYGYIQIQIHFALFSGAPSGFTSTLLISAQDKCTGEFFADSWVGEGFDAQRSCQFQSRKLVEFGNVYVATFPRARV